MAASVLVVEDEPDIRNLVVFHLEREGFRVRTAGTGAHELRTPLTAIRGASRERGPRSALPCQCYEVI